MIPMAVRVPILQQNRRLIASIQEDLSDQEILDLQSRLLDMVVTKGVTGVIIDVSAVDVLDSFISRTLSEIAGGVYLRGAKLVLVGIQPEVAMALVLLGLTLKDVETALDLDRGMALLDRSGA